MDSIAAAEPISAEFLPASAWTRAYAAHTGAPCPLTTRKLTELARDGVFPAEQRGAKREWSLDRRHLPALVAIVRNRVGSAAPVFHAA